MESDQELVEMMERAIYNFYSDDPNERVVTVSLANLRPLISLARKGLAAKGLVLILSRALMVIHDGDFPGSAHLKTGMREALSKYHESIKEG